MREFDVSVTELNKFGKELLRSDKIYLTGTVYTARDAAHMRLAAMLDRGEELPFDPAGAVIYYAGPSPTRPDGQIGSFGPTTSSRMDRFAPRLYDLGLSATVGKGDRSREVIDAIIRNSALYLCAGGGFGALISRSVRKIEVIAFPELGCESIKKLEVERLPLIVGIDSGGGSVFDR